ncbi:serine/threonine-protein kinase [Candidatus Zixiibacteriota bacterium]
MQPERALSLEFQIGEVLLEAHRVAVIHRDIKPANILIDQQGRARLVGFGLARIEGAEEITRTGSTMGTVGYMSPEQVEAKPVDHRSDIFPAGVVIQEMITGRQPSRLENTATTLLAIINDEPDPPAPTAIDNYFGVQNKRTTRLPGRVDPSPPCPGDPLGDHPPFKEIAGRIRPTIAILP